MTGAAIIATVCGIVGGFVVIMFAKPLVALFVGSGQNEVMSLSKEYLVLNGVFYVILGLLFVYRNALQGIGSSMIAFSAVFGNWLCVRLLHLCLCRI